ncbi:MAG: 1,4-dihydroxy-2-naphthoyl-CoA hydrolase [Chlamydiia bacterium]|nr:1,4-dihydroxy-2-naphthoyl-CoA hydrolase [Chlamydiia bacterium]
MFQYRRLVKMADTDASGVIYFANVQIIALEAFEEYLSRYGFDLGVEIEKGDFLFPIVHTEADYLSPVTVGDEVNVNLSLEKVGNSSFTMKYEIHSMKNDMTLATVKMTHVAMCKETKKSMRVPQELIALFSRLS